MLPLSSELHSESESHSDLYHFPQQGHLRQKDDLPITHYPSVAVQESEVKVTGKRDIFTSCAALDHRTIDRCIILDQLENKCY